MGFDPCNCPLKIRESTKTPTPNMGIHLGVWGVLLLTLFCTLRNMKCDSWAKFWPTPLQALALVVSPKLGLWHKNCYKLMKISQILQASKNICLRDERTYIMKRTHGESWLRNIKEKSNPWTSLKVNKWKKWKEMDYVKSNLWNWRYKLGLQWITWITFAHRKITIIRKIQWRYEKKP